MEEPPNFDGIFLAKGEIFMAITKVYQSLLECNQGNFPQNENPPEIAEVFVGFLALISRGGRIFVLLESHAPFECDMRLKPCC